jgi:hypothetical protein
MTPVPDPLVRPATPADIPSLASHHRKMFEDIWNQQGIVVDPCRMKAL